MKSIFEIFNAKHILDIKAKTKDDVLVELCNGVAGNPVITDPEGFLEAIREREKTMSTGIGLGVAIPHAKITSIKDFVISANLIAIKLRDEIKPEIVVAYLNSPVGQKELQSRASGSFQKSLNLKILSQLPIPVPPLEKQKILAKYLTLINDHKMIKEKENELREKITDTIIMKFMEVR